MRSRPDASTSLYASVQNSSGSECDEREGNTNDVAAQVRNAAVWEALGAPTRAVRCLQQWEQRSSNDGFSALPERVQAELEEALRSVIVSVAGILTPSLVPDLLAAVLREPGQRRVTSTAASPRASPLAAALAEVYVANDRHSLTARTALSALCGTMQFHEVQNLVSDVAATLMLQRAPPSLHAAAFSAARRDFRLLRSGSPLEVPRRTRQRFREGSARSVVDYLLSTDIVEPFSWTETELVVHGVRTRFPVLTRRGTIGAAWSRWERSERSLVSRGAFYRIARALTRAGSLSEDHVMHDEMFLLHESFTMLASLVARSAPASEREGAIRALARAHKYCHRSFALAHGGDEFPCAMHSPKWALASEAPTAQTCQICASCQYVLQALARSASACSLGSGSAAADPVRRGSSASGSTGVRRVSAQRSEREVRTPTAADGAACNIPAEDSAEVALFAKRRLRRYLARMVRAGHWDSTVLSLRANLQRHEVLMTVAWGSDALDHFTSCGEQTSVLTCGSAWHTAAVYDAPRDSGRPPRDADGGALSPTAVYHQFFEDVGSVDAFAALCAVRTALGDVRCDFPSATDVVVAVPARACYCNPEFWAALRCDHVDSTAPRICRIVFLDELSTIATSGTGIHDIVVRAIAAVQESGAPLESSGLCELVGAAARTRPHRTTKCATISLDRSQAALATTRAYTWCEQHNIPVGIPLKFAALGNTQVRDICFEKDGSVRVGTYPGDPLLRVEASALGHEPIPLEPCRSRGEGGHEDTEPSRRSARATAAWSTTGEGSGALRVNRGNSPSDGAGETGIVGVASVVHHAIVLRRNATATSTAAVEGHANVNDAMEIADESSKAEEGLDGRDMVSYCVRYALERLAGGKTGITECCKIPAVDTDRSPAGHIDPGDAELFPPGWAREDQLESETEPSCVERFRSSIRELRCAGNEPECPPARVRSVRPETLRDDLRDMHRGLLVFPSVREVSIIQRVLALSASDSAARQVRRRRQKRRAESDHQREQQSEQRRDGSAAPPAASGPPRVRQRRVRTPIPVEVDTCMRGALKRNPHLTIDALVQYTRTSVQNLSADVTAKVLRGKASRVRREALRQLAIEEQR